MTLLRLDRACNAENQQLQYSIATRARGVDRKIFSGLPKGWKQISRGSGGHSPQTLKGISQFCTTFVAVFTKLVSN